MAKTTAYGIGTRFAGHSISGLTNDKRRPLGSGSCGCVIQNGRDQQGSRLFARREACQRQHGNIIVLTERDRSFSGLLRRGPGSKQRMKPIEAVKFPVRVARLQQSIGVEAELIAGLQAHLDCDSIRLAHKTQRQRRLEIELLPVKEGWQMAGVGKRNRSVRIQAKDNARGESTLHSARQAVVQCA